MVTSIDAIFRLVFIMNINLSNIETQLKKRWKYNYKWLQKQNNLWDNYTNFIYLISDWDCLVEAIARLVQEKKLPKEAAFYYAINRWYNYWSSVAVEHIFCSHPQVEPAKNEKDKEVDFSISGIPFDHKTSVFPKGFENDFAFAKAHKEQLLYWLYNHQSQQGRKHLANRLFIIVHNKNGNHWKLKAEISLLQQAISNYVTTFEPGHLTKLNFSEINQPLSDIIWVTQ